MPLGNKKTTIALTRNEIRKNLKDQRDQISQNRTKNGKWTGSLRNNGRI